MDILQASLGLQELEGQGLVLFAQADALENTGSVQEAHAILHQLVPRQGELLGMARQLASQHPGFDVAPFARDLMNTLFRYADASETLGRADWAEQARQAAAEVAAQVGPEGAWEVASAQAWSALRRGRFTEALALLVEAERIAGGTGDATLCARAALNLADLYQWLGDGSRCLAAVDRARRLVPAPGPGETLSRSDIANILRTRATDPSTLERGQRTIWAALATRMANTAGLAHRLQGDRTQARACFLEARGGMDGSAAVGLDFQLARLDIEESKPGDALAFLEALRTQAERDDNLRPKVAVFLRLEAEALLGQDLEAAAQRIQAALAWLERYPDPDLAWKAHWLHARVLVAQGRSEESLAAYARAAEAVDTLRIAPLGPRLDSCFLRDKVPMYEEAILLAAALGDAPRCLALMDQVKSRALSSALAAGGTAPESGEVQELSRRIDALEYTSGENPGQAQAILAHRHRLLAERQEAIERERAADPRWRLLSVAPAMDLPELQATLASVKASALSLFLAGTTIVAVLFDGTSVAVGAQEMTARTSTALAQFVENVQSTWDQRGYDPATVGLALEDLVPASLAARALAADRLVVSPHGVLHLVPWAGLPHRAGRVLDRVAVSIIPNLCVLPGLAKAGRGRVEGVLLVGDPAYPAALGVAPLAFAKAELEEVGALYADAGLEAGRCVGKRATCAAFRTACDSDRAPGQVLHVACHGDFDPDYPQVAGLLLRDGRMDASEIAAMTLPFQDVVLSACFTGWRAQRVQDIPLHGDDVVGLPGAFLEAGGSAVVVSIPAADDEMARRMMVLYHGNRIEGQEPARALAAAQRTLLREEPELAYTVLGFTAYGAPQVASGRLGRVGIPVLDRILRQTESIQDLGRRHQATMDLVGKIR
ncbi:MAG: CHAT domain-containing protein [Thermoplasmatota archaeon]